MERRTYLTTIGTTASLGVPLFQRYKFATGSALSISITETNTPLAGGDLLEVAATVENEDSTLRNFDLELFIEDNQSASEAVSVDPDETEEIEFQHRLYPVRADVEMDVRVAGDGYWDQQQIEVAAVEELDEEDVNPTLDVMVQPNTDVIFEVDDTVPDDSSEDGTTHWFLNGEYKHQSSEPWYPDENQANGYAYWLQSFTSEDVYEAAVAVDNEEQNYTNQWVISVDSDGIDSPVVENIEPEAIGSDSTESYDVEIEVSSQDDDLDRIVWWREGESYIDGVTELTGSEDTASRATPGGTAPTVWVITENNVVTEASPWDVEETESEEETGTDGEERPLEELRSVEEFGERLKREGMIITYLQMVGDSIHLDYQTQATTESDEITEVAIVASAYADLVASGHESWQLHVIFLDQYRIDLGGFWIMFDWAESYVEGQISWEEYGELILDTYGHE